jgi:hypothetical protein
MIHLGIEFAELTALPEERPFVERMKRLDAECFFPGRGVEISEDFKEIAERKFWSRIFLDAARAIFDRRIGIQEYSFWQAQAIHQSYSIGLLFEHSVREADSQWYADTLDRRQWDEWNASQNAVKR